MEPPSQVVIYVLTKAFIASCCMQLHTCTSYDRNVCPAGRRSWLAVRNRNGQQSAFDSVLCFFSMRNLRELQGLNHSEQRTGSHPRGEGAIDRAKWGKVLSRRCNCIVSSSRIAETTTEGTMERLWPEFLATHNGGPRTVLWAPSQA